MTDKSDRPDGYYGCSLPPGACGCPQDVRHKCTSAHWIATPPTRDGAEGASEKGSRLWRAATAVALHRPLSRQVCHVPTPLMHELLDALLYSNSAPDGVRNAISPPAVAAEPVALANALEKSDWSNTSIGNKALIQNAIITLRASPPVRGDREAIVECLTNCAQIIDVVRLDWVAAKVWTEWDQSVRDQITKCLAILSLLVQPGAGERESAIEFCITVVEEECGLAEPDRRTEHKRACLAAGQAIRDRLKCAIRNPDSRQAPHSNSETES